MEFFERVHNMLIFSLSLSLSLSDTCTHSRSISPFLIHVHTRTHTLSHTHAPIFSLEIQLERFPLWKGGEFFPTSDFSHSLRFFLLFHFFLPEQKISLQSTVAADAADATVVVVDAAVVVGGVVGIVDGRRHFAEWPPRNKREKNESILGCRCKHLRRSDPIDVTWFHLILIQWLIST